MKYKEDVIAAMKLPPFNCDNCTEVNPVYSLNYTLLSMYYR